MKIVLRLLVGLIVLIALLLGAGLMLPATFKVERSAHINAPASAVYPLIATPKSWPSWSVWNERDPNMKQTFSGAESGVGAVWTWQSATEGNGRMEFTAATPDQQVDYQLSFVDFDMTSHGALSLTPDASGVQLRWTNEGSLGMNPVNRWMGLFMDKLVGPDFEAGLAKLKRVAESQPAPLPKPVDAPAEPLVVPESEPAGD